MKIPGILLLLPFLVQAKTGRKQQCDTSDLPVSTVVTPANRSLYDQARKQFASKMGTTATSDHMLSPLAVVYCKNDDDVLATIQFASKCGYKLSIRSGGHQYSGFSSCEAGTKCIQIDLSEVETFSYNGTEVTLGVGLDIQQARGLLAPLGLVIPMGICNHVGVGGHFQTSSLSLAGRSFGLGMDYMKSFRMAVANGTIVTVTPQNDPALFKAVLGGGPGSWGVILDYTFNAFSQSDYPHSAFIAMRWKYSNETLVKVGTTFNTISAIASGERDFTPFINIWNPPELRNISDFGYYIELLIVWVGIDRGDLYSNVTDNYKRFIQPFRDVDTSNATLLDLKLPLTYGLPLLSGDFDFGPFRYNIGSFATEKFNFNESFWEITAKELDSRITLAAAMPVGFSTQFGTMGGSGLGSQIYRNKGLNSYGLREAIYHVDDWFFFATDAQEILARDHIEGYKKATKDFWKYNGNDADYTFMTTQTVNAQTDSLAKNWDQYYPSRKIFHDLKEVKGRVDPCDLFSTDNTVPLPKSGLKNKLCPCK